MVLSGSKRTTYMKSLTSQPQGGGSKKAGFPYQVGRESYTSVFLGSTAPVSGNCCSLTRCMANRFTLFPNQNLPVGWRSGIKMY
jgi:hypothetical protein